MNVTDDRQQTDRQTDGRRHIANMNVSSRSLKKGQDSQKKKSQSGNISPIWGEAPTVPIRTKICMVGILPDVITYAKFQIEIFRGYDFTGGRISHFPIEQCNDSHSRTFVSHPKCSFLQTQSVPRAEVNCQFLFYIYYF